jgi:arylsulfatase A-like enzyme
MMTCFDACRSDNGGCPYGGGKNGPLRGTKGTVFEGGTKVDAFIYSPLLSGLGGAKYHNLFHVTDWFPTLLDFASISYEAKPGFELDGVSHYNAFFNEADTPRHYMLYNSFYNVPGYDTDLWTNLTFAVRYDKYV